LNKIKLLVVAKHPVYYTVPIFRKIAEDELIESKIIYLDDISLREAFHPEINAKFKPEQDLLSGYKYIFLKNIGSKIEKITKIGFFSHFNPGIVKEIIHSNYEYVLVHGYDKFTLWLVLITANLTGKKVIFRGEVTDKIQLPETILGRTKLVVRNMIVRLFLSKCQAVLFSCTGNKIHLEKFIKSGKKLHPFPCAVDNEYHLNQYKLLKEKRNNLRSKLNINEDDIVIIFPARLTERKRPLDLIEAVNQIGKSNIIIMYVGDGPQSKNIEKRACELGVRVITTGHIQPQKMPEYYVAADIFALLSDYDPSPKALNEAMNYCLPLIVSNAAGTAKDLVKEDNGYIVNVGDINDIANKIEKLINNINFKILGLNSQKIVSLWSIEADVKGLINAIKELEEFEK